MIDKNALLFSLTANKQLTEDVAKILGIKVSPATVSHFADGEILCEPIESVREKNCYIIQSTCGPVTEHLFEILIFVDALKRASAHKITVVMPYYGYARQDRKSKPRQPITSRLVADLLKTAGVDRVVCVDLHASQIQGFFSCLVDEMSAIPLLAGKHCLMIDDMIDTAGSCSEGAKALLAKGAKSVRIACTHGIFSGPASKRLLEGDLFQEIVTTNSIPLKEEMKNPKVTVLSLAPMLAKIIEHVEMGLPLTYVYDMFTNKI